MRTLIIALLLVVLSGCSSTGRKNSFSIDAGTSKVDFVNPDKTEMELKVRYECKW